MSAGIVRLFGSLGFVLRSEESRRVLLDRSAAADGGVRAATASIIQQVRNHGDAALTEFASRFDGVDLGSLEVPRARAQEALDSLPDSLRTAMQRAATNIRKVHAASLPQTVETESEHGIVVGRRPDPLDRVGIYAPGGKASYFSSVLMGAIPARCAGVGQVILCSPPGRSGAPSDAVLAAAALAKVDRIFAVGGAGAIAAMALGTTSIPSVQRVVGPGNAYVAEAKLQLAGLVSFDCPAGPSELLVICDESADITSVVRELLAQAEHDPQACVVAVCSSQRIAEVILGKLRDDLRGAQRGDTISLALQANGAILWYESLVEAVDFASRYAPEHVLVATSEAAVVAGGIRNAGTIFLGESSSVAFGDYLTGANHVLPTGGMARSFSGLSTLDFFRWTTYQSVSRDAARTIAADVTTMALAEGLPAHAAAATAWGGKG